MAVKRSSKVAERQSDKEVDWSPAPVVAPKKRIQIWKWIALAILAVGLWWYKTNTWPITAIVGYKPIFRHQVNQMLYKQGGKSVLDSLITETIVRNELKSKNISVSSQEVDKKIDEIVKSLGEDVNFEDLLAERGLTMEEVRKQVALQAGIEKALADKATFSAEELDQFLKENGTFISGSTSAEKQANAESALKQQKLQESMTSWIADLKAAAKIWYVGDSK